MNVYFLNIMQQCHACDAINPKHWSIINWLSEMLVYLCAEHYLPPKTEAADQ